MKHDASENPPFSTKRAAKLGAKKHREAERLFLAEGEAIIREAKEAPRHIFGEPGEIKRVSSLTSSVDPVGVFPFVDVPMGKLLSVASLQASPERSGGDVGVEETLESRFATPRFTAKAERSDVTILLHGVQDPGNVGTVIRSAHAFGAGVALSVGCADLYNPKTVRGTMGAIFHVPVSRDVDSMEFLQTARRNGFTSVAAMPEDGESSRNLPEKKLVIVVGSEGSGLPDEVAEACDRRVAIPSEAPSLNAAVAASIMLYEAHLRVLT